MRNCAKRQTGPGCDCGPCRNFAALAVEAYPKDVVRFFGEIGIDRDQPFELSHYSRMPSGLHLYGGWHYFAGLGCRFGTSPQRPLRDVRGRFGIMVA